MSRLLKGGKSLLLAMDQGLEHGPTDFNKKNIDPDYVLKIAVRGGFNGVILNKGVALKYFENYAGRVPLILKLSGKTSIPAKDKDLISSQIASVKDAVRLGADAVGYTVYVGVEEEPEMIKEFGKIEEEARDYGMPVVAWMYPKTRNPTGVKIVSYAARVGMELGADMIKTYYTGSEASFKKVVEAAQDTYVLCSGGLKKSGKQFLTQVKSVMNAGAAGLAVGRNVWQHKEPLKISRALRAIVFKNASVKSALGFLK
jgi:class I fructose-bisphosphate aldolase